MFKTKLARFKANFFIKIVEPKNLPVQNTWPKLNINNFIYSNLPYIYLRNCTDNVNYGNG